MIAIQDQVIPTNNYKKAILNEKEVQDKCRKCHANSETIQHLLNGCSSLAATEYKARHRKILHQEIVQKMLKRTGPKIPYYRYEPETITENKDYKIYWDRTIRTDKEETHNRPDIVVLDKVKKRVQLVDIAIPLSANMQRTYNEKRRKYEELSKQIRGMWKVEAVETIPVIISSTRLIHAK